MMAARRRCFSPQRPCRGKPENASVDSPGPPGLSRDSIYRHCRRHGAYAFLAQRWIPAAWRNTWQPGSRSRLPETCRSQRRRCDLLRRSRYEIRPPRDRVDYGSDTDAARERVLVAAHGLLHQFTFIFAFSASLSALYAPLVIPWNFAPDLTSWANSAL